MIILPHLTIKTYGGLHVSDTPEMSGGGTQPKPHAPTRPPQPPKKKKKR